MATARQDRALSPRRSTRAKKAVALASMAVMMAGCIEVDDREAAAVWDVAPDQRLDADTTTFTALVHRVGCNNGVTGDVNDPAIEVSDHQVVITFTVSPGEPSSATCQGNEPVAYEVALPDALGDRELVDGECVPIGTNDNADCDPDGVRHTP